VKYLKTYLENKHFNITITDIKNNDNLEVTIKQIEKYYELPIYEQLTEIIEDEVSCAWGDQVESKCEIVSLYIYKTNSGILDFDVNVNNNAFYKPITIEDWYIKNIGVTIDEYLQSNKLGLL